MKNLYSYSLGKDFGPRFENSFIELWVYDGKSEEERYEVSKEIKALMPEDKHGVTSFTEWVVMCRPTIKIFIDTADNPLYRAFITIPHEIEHAVGTGLMGRLELFKIKDIRPGCEKLAHFRGILTFQFQSAYLKYMGMAVTKRRKNEEK